MISNSPIRKQKRAETFSFFDFYRFIGAIVVALVHYSLIYFPIDEGHRQYLHNALQPVLGLFFTLSGFVIMHVYDGKVDNLTKYGEFIKKRLARLYPLFLLTFAISILWGLFTSGQSEMFSPKAILPNLLLIHSFATTNMLTFDYPSWSISAEIFVYALFPVFVFLIDRAKGFAPALPFVAAFGVAVIFSVFSLGDWTTATFNGGCLRAAPSFLAGMILCRLSPTVFANFRVPVWFAHAMAIASVPLMLAGVPGIVMLVYMGALVLVMAKAEPQTPGVLSRPWAKTLGDASFGFYLWHALVAPLVLGAFARSLHLPAQATYALAPVAIVITTAISIASFRYFENPARRYLGGSGFTTSKKRGAVISR